ncbi:MAG: lipid-A-disaccharide synthase N-terminal domain-containing protein [Planctomycetota bacterium]|nr:MAG: lipid-A-disaccharide synthase N-terminal domain-containing protein [Planctomycetota bacterium]
MAGPTQIDGQWKDELWNNIYDPWFIFGMGAQGLFFLRFIIQWIVSEKKKRSTIPVIFWYLSLAGAAATFVYAVHEAQPVFILAQILACVIYIRNLMLIYQRDSSRKRAGLPAQEPDSSISEEDLLD